MLEVLNKIVCSSIMSITGLCVIKKLIGNKNKLTISAFIYLAIFTIISVSLYPIQYTGLYTITIFMINIIFYKKIFKITLEQSIISNAIFMFILFISDLLVTIIFRAFYSVEQIRTDFITSVMANLVTGFFSILIINTKILYNKLKKFYDNTINKKTMINILFLILLIIGFSNLAYKITVSQTYNISYLSNTIIMIIFAIITGIFIESKNNYKQLSDEYDSLFSYIQNFEDWIEKEQLNRHEYKNQLAVLRCLTKEKNVKNKIDEILEDNINIEGQVVHKLKELPKGGMKGLMYYKAAIAQKNKIKLEVDVSLGRKSILTKLAESQVKDLCKLIGIYFDNAIEAAVETKKKIILLEVYELKDRVNIILSNTFKESKSFHKRNEKGVTTKGEGRGNGLYFANNIVSKNKWLESKQEVIDNYYIQTLTIKKLD